MQSSIRPRILYADDNEDACFMLGSLLGFSNVETTSTGTVDEALRTDTVTTAIFHLLKHSFKSVH
jgi:CheY-like chemotaxis protein